MKSSIPRRATLSASALLALFAGHALAQTAPAADPKPSSQLALSQGTQIRRTGNPQRDTLLALMRPMIVNFQDQRLEDILNFLRESTGAEMDIMWQDDQNAIGLDKEAKVTLNSNGLPALTLIERVLQKADAFSGNLQGNNASQWQMADSGEIQIGPKARLNAFKRVEIYDISDMLTELPEFTNAPTFDLQSVLQSSGGGGGGQSPFQSGANQNSTLTSRSLTERTDDLVTLVTRLVEPDQWETAGGDGATVQAYAKTLIVNAPDYVHRQLNGYAYWPDTPMASANGQVVQRRWVSLNGIFESSALAGMGAAPVTAVIPGGGG